MRSPQRGLARELVTRSCQRIGPSSLAQIPTGSTHAVSTLDLFVRAADSETSFFTITAIADPGVIPRVLELFAKRGWVPSFLQSRQVGAHGEALSIDILMPGLATAPP